MLSNQKQPELLLQSGLIFLPYPTKPPALHRHRLLHFLAKSVNLGHDAVHGEAAHVNGHSRTAGRAHAAALAGGGDGAGLALAVVILIDINGLVRAEALTGSAADALLRINPGDNRGRSRERSRM